MKIFKDIITHLELLEALTKFSELLVNAAEERKFSVIEEITENRGRLLEIIKELQEGIENEIESLDVSAITQDELDIIRSWEQDVNKLVKRNDHSDQVSTEILERLKEETTKDIVTTFKNRQLFKGYDLSNLKK